MALGRQGDTCVCSDRGTGWRGWKISRTDPSAGPCIDVYQCSWMVNKVCVTSDVICRHEPPAPKRQGTHFEQQQPASTKQGDSHFCEPVATHRKTLSPQRKEMRPTWLFQDNTQLRRADERCSGARGEGNCSGLL